MNEFIVWDKDCEVFIDEIMMNRNGIPFHKGWAVDEETYIFFNHIGKTDIEGNKIYADCSIVEFEMSGSRINFKATGYFYFDKGDLSYEFVCLKIDKKMIEPRKDINWRDAYSKTIKIIGTLQENPELLETK